jgi:hypothetical protein
MIYLKFIIGFSYNENENENSSSPSQNMQKNKSPLLDAIHKKQTKYGDVWDE